MKKIRAVFYRSEAGNEPVRDWLKGLDREDRRRVGEDIATVEFGWPLGMPTCRPMGAGLHEVRTTLAGNRVARIFFYVDRTECFVLVHAFIKKSRAAPDGELRIARERKARHEGAWTA